jgi:hypothetical protein
MTSGSRRLLGLTVNGTVSGLLRKLRTVAANRLNRIFSSPSFNPALTFNRLNFASLSTQASLDFQATLSAPLISSCRQTSTEEFTETFHSRRDLTHFLQHVRPLRSALCATKCSTIAFLHDSHPLPVQELHLPKMAGYSDEPGSRGCADAERMAKTID